jgi:hypothetical protein
LPTALKIRLTITAYPILQRCMALLSCMRE